MVEKNTTMVEKDYGKYVIYNKIILNYIINKND